jgi:hypothetical protein
MWWIIILIPLCVWFSYSTLMYLNILSLVFSLLILLGYFIYEAIMIRKSRERSRLPFLVMIELIITVSANIVISLIN